jgi:uncharacterized protein YndB with AHSA1/START domain
MSNDVRATIIDTHNPTTRSASIVINAPAQAIFDVLAQPSQHAHFDGSGTLVGATVGPDRVKLGDRFGMNMRIKLPYRITNEVVEFDEGRAIAWRHFGGHRWRYELESIDANTTKVTETFDGGTARLQLTLKLMNAYENNEKAIAKTLVRLKQLMESGSADS